MEFVYSMEMSQSLAPAVPDYEADDVLVVAGPEQLRALVDDVRARIVRLLRERAQSTTELAEQLKLAKGTVAHHLKVLESAGLIRVVRTRRVRAMTERYYGRVARLFVIKSTESLPDGLGPNAIAAVGLRQAADEIVGAAPEPGTYANLQVRLTAQEAKRFQKRLDRLVRDFRDAEDPAGEQVVLVLALYTQEGG
jgi:DNA-binding transcriptional ArsR family regulator